MRKADTDGAAAGPGGGPGELPGPTSPSSRSCAATLHSIAMAETSTTETAEVTKGSLLFTTSIPGCKGLSTATRK